MDQRIGAERTADEPAFGLGAGGRFDAGDVAHHLGRNALGDFLHRDQRQIFEDGIFPRAVAVVHPRWHTPHVAILCSGVMASIGILGCHLAGDFFLGIDILVTAMLVNFILMCASVLALPGRNPALARAVTVVPQRALQVPLALAGNVVLGGFLVVHTIRDLTLPVAAWYFRSTPVWLGVMAMATVIYLREMGALRRSGVDVSARFATLPPE